MYLRVLEPHAKRLVASHHEIVLVLGSRGESFSMCFSEILLYWGLRTLVPCAPTSRVSCLRFGLLGFGLPFNSSVLETAKVCCPASEDDRLMVGCRFDGAVGYGFACRSHRIESNRIAGTEVHICVNVAKELGAAGSRVRVVSMPCWELLEKQDEEYQLSGG